jgi:NAD(P)-dependent dehydrogenase (short-subunit alcohol dehydrogenase family)
MLITGASSGIGKACADLFHGLGWNVYGASRSIQQDGSHAFVALSMDVDCDESVAQGVHHIIEREGRIDVVINCAGFAIAGSVEDTSVAEAKAQFDTNFFGLLRVCQSALPIMRQQGSGLIIIVSSLAGLTGVPFQAFYSASKYAVEGMTETLRMEVMPFGIRVVLVEPGNFRTGLTASRRRTAASGINQAYRGPFETSVATMEHAEINGPDPIAVAKLIARIVSDPKPKLRYTVGNLSERIGVSLKRVLPYKLYEALAMRSFGLRK